MAFAKGYSFERFMNRGRPPLPSPPTWEVSRIGDCVFQIQQEYLQERKMEVRMHVPRARGSLAAIQPHKDPSQEGSIILERSKIFSMVFASIPGSDSSFLALTIGNYLQWSW